MSTSTLWYYGDPHGRFDPLIAAVQQAGKARPQAVVILGDFDLETPLEQALAPILDQVEIAWIPGNHDCDRVGYYEHLFDGPLAAHNLHGRVRTLGGVPVAGLGGVFRERIWYPPAPPRFPSPREYLHAIAPKERWRSGLPLRQRSTIFWSDYAALWDRRAEILVCHEAPSCHRHGFEALDELATAMGARMIVHGHHHETYRAWLPNGIEVLGIGLAAVVSREGEVIAPGLYDTQRAGHWRRPR